MQSSTGSYLNFVIILAEKELIETPIKIINNNGLKEKVENVKTKYIAVKDIKVVEKYYIQLMLLRNT